ncbi:unnamed protein product, partial [Ceratitis capitata]
GEEIVTSVLKSSSAPMPATATHAIDISTVETAQSDNIQHFHKLSSSSALPLGSVGAGGGRGNLQTNGLQLPVLSVRQLCVLRQFYN